MHKPQAMPSDLEAVTLGLLAYCRANDWAGYDPYDALNSRIFEALPFLNSRLPRLALTQLLKRSPVNIRPLLLIPKTQNPKALSLFLGGLLKLSRSGLLDDESPIEFMARKLVELRSPGIPYSSWGYSFPWQTRTIVVPRGSPNLVCTIFVTNALLDLYEAGRESRYLEMAVSAAEYISTLCWTEGDVASFAYPLATLRSRIHNANFLGAALLARVAKHSGEKKFLDPAMKAARWSASKQHADGSWPYGELPKQQWIDNFHTGYNLTGLRVLGECAGTSEFEPRVRRHAALFPRPHLSHRRALRGPKHHLPGRVQAPRRRQRAAGPLRLRLGHEAHARRARRLLLPRSALLHDSDFLHAVVAGVDVPCPVHPHGGTGRFRPREAGVGHAGTSEGLTVIHDGVNDSNQGGARLRRRPGGPLCDCHTRAQRGDVHRTDHQVRGRSVDSAGPVGYCQRRVHRPNGRDCFGACQPALLDQSHSDAGTKGTQLRREGARLQRGL
jgi:hypothetical protein